MKKVVIGIIIGAIIFGSIGVYAATILASEVTYTNNNQKNVQYAIDDLYNKSKNYCPNDKVCIKKETNEKKCKRATSLHVERCEQTDTNHYCSGAGYTISGSKGTTTIAYGSLGTSGALTPGDAFDCDVNGDGYYDVKSERFYYVSEYYNTITKQFESDTAVLIYYNNVSQGSPTNLINYHYNSNKTNYSGPTTAMEQLPTTSQWPNISLKNVNRNILNENSTNTYSNGLLPNSYSYEGYAARLLTVQEVNAACNITVGSKKYGETQSCYYLMENTKYSTANVEAWAYWLESAYSQNGTHAWNIDGHYRYVGYNGVTGQFYAVRPAIDVPVTDIEY